MTDHTLIQGGRVVAADGEYDADVLIDGERIAAVGAVEAPEGATVIDASGCLLLPGLIDNHTHMAMPFMGMRSADDYDTGTRAAAAGGVTCIVDFSIQREPDGLASALEEWKGRADGAAHVDYGFHMAITNANAPTIEDMGAMVDAGVSSFKLFMAYKGELMVRDDELAATMERARDLGALVMVHAENGDIVDMLVTRALAAGDTSAINHALTRPEMVEAEATGRAARLAEYTGASLFVVHVTCAAAAAEVEAAQQRGAHVSGETCAQYLVNTIDDLREAGRRGLSLHLLPAAAGRLQPRAALGLRAPRRARERLDRPLPVRRRAEGPRARRLQPRAQRPAGDPAPPRQALGRGRGRRAHHAEPARRPHEHDGRPPLRPRRQGRDRPRQGRRHRRPRPATPRSPTASRRRS